MKKSSKKSSRVQVAIIMGSDSDLPVMKQAAEALKEMKIGYEMKVVSAHRTPVEKVKFAQAAHGRGIQVIIAGAGGAAHLPGMVASLTTIPVIGVPVPLSTMQGLDSLLSIVQMPKGVPVATVAVGNAFNAGLLAAKIVAHGGSKLDVEIVRRLENYKDGLRNAVLKKKIDG